MLFGETSRAHHHGFTKIKHFVKRSPSFYAKNLEQKSKKQLGPKSLHGGLA
jgi:hypothetical protein